MRKIVLALSLLALGGCLTINAGTPPATAPPVPKEDITAINTRLDAWDKIIPEYRGALVNHEGRLKTLEAPKPVEEVPAP